jgi:hypothetical protein
MTDPIRAALERLVARLDETTDPNGPVPAWSDSYLAARAELAQPEPAGEVSEPAHAELISLALNREPWATWLQPGGSLESAHCELSDLLRAAIALDRSRRAPVPPAEGEVGELVGLIRQIALAWEPDACLLGNMTAGQLARAADLLQRLQPLQPVAVGERLPCAEDCDAEGRCWFHSVGREWCDWYLLKASCATETETHWLPFHALPLPTPSSENVQ